MGFGPFEVALAVAVPVRMKRVRIKTFLKACTLSSLRGFSISSRCMIHGMGILFFNGFMIFWFGENQFKLLHSA